MIEFPFVYLLFHFDQALELSELTLGSMRERAESHVRIGCEKVQIGKGATTLCSLKLLELIESTHFTPQNYYMSTVRVSRGCCKHETVERAELWSSSLKKNEINL
jgi:hypothetical protein